MLEVPNWYDTFIESKSMLSGIFPCLSRMIADPLWNETIKEAIFWYLQTNHPNRIGLTSALVLQQACLELISWVKTVIVDQEIPEAEFGNSAKYPAEKRIRHLFSKLNIPVSLPNLPDSANYIKNICSCNRTDIHDIPKLITYIRNGIVHPNCREKRISSLDTPSEIDVWKIGQLSIELCILSLCGYQRKYSNRITATRVGQAENVPWKINTL